MSYYEQFSVEAKQTILPLFQKAEALTKQVQTLLDRIADEEANAISVRVQIEQLKRDGAESMTGDTDTLQAFKDQLNQLQIDLGNSDEIVHIAKDELLPKQQTERNGAIQKLKNALTAFMRSKRPIADAAMNKLLTSAITEQENYLDGFRQIYADYGQSLSVSDESMIPGPICATDILKIKRQVADQEEKQGRLKPVSDSFEGDLQSEIDTPKAETDPQHVVCAAAIIEDGKSENDNHLNNKDL